jgi:ubiquinone/menaquinone biosynthesis C-methylase UbiE
MLGGLNAPLERSIANKFEEIADIGWFPEDVPANSAKLAVVREMLTPFSGKAILDAGCARGRFVKALAPLGAKMYGVDLTETFLRSAKINAAGAVFAGGSLSALPFRSERFDAVYCVEALEHLPDTELALSEMARVLKPGGALLVIDKSLIGLHPGSGLPNFWAKPWAERKGKWMYPPDFAFRERWFWPWRLARTMRRYCASVQVRFIPGGHGKASCLYKLAPFLSLDVAWIGKK